MSSMISRLAALFILGCFLLVPLLVHAQASTPTPSSLFQRTDVTAPPIALPNLINLFQNDSPDTLLQSVFGFIVDLLALIGGLVAFGYVLYGGFLYVTSGGNPQGADKGKNAIIGGVVGILILALAFVIVQYVTQELLK